VPGDPTQIVYVWFDALANYISALGYGSDAGYGGDADEFRAYWTEADRITHVIGKGITRFHAVYWPAILLSAGLRPPTELLVHGYVTVNGRKVSKSEGNGVSPAEARAAYGTDALRYYLLRHIGSRRDGDFSLARLGEAYAHELADDLGNLAARTLALFVRHGTPSARAASTLANGLEDEIERCLDDFAVDRALDGIWRVVDAANAYINRTEPWKLAKQGRRDELEDVLAELHAALLVLARALSPFLPETADRLMRALSGVCAEQLFPKTLLRAE
jgi:methionyl-tRNA synthetase